MYDEGIYNAVINSVKIGYDDRGFLDVWLHLEYEDGWQGFGGYTLYLPKSFTHHKMMSVAGHHIFRCMEIAGVSQWDRMTGRTLRVDIKDGLIKAIGHIVKDDWYCPAKDFAAAREEML